ncbi:hypothetical protein F66182_16487, partial [Fusarium sp. NRRL 66182]
DYTDGNGEEHYDDGDYYAEDGYYDYEEEGSYWPDHPPAEDQHCDPPEELRNGLDTQEPEDEKSRLQRAEAMLLPSQPPGESSSGPHNTGSTPTAPDISEEDHTFDHYTVSDSGHVNIVPSSTISVDTVVPGPSHSRLPDIPNYEHTDDKHELERRRLMEEASAPSSNQHVDRVMTSGPHMTPTAPILEEEDELGNLHPETDESLPSYRR